MLSLKAKDVLELHTKASPDWWRGTRDGAEGLIAAKYVKILEDEEVSVREKEEDDTGVVTKHMSYNTSRSMWEQKTLEKRRSKDRAPDLLQVILASHWSILLILASHWPILGPAAGRARHVRGD